MKLLKPANAPNDKLGTGKETGTPPNKTNTPKASGLETDDHYAEWLIIDDDLSRLTAPQQQAQAVISTAPTLGFAALSMADLAICACMDCADEGMVDRHIHQVIAKGEGKCKYFPLQAIDSDSSEVSEEPAWTPRSPSSRTQHTNTPTGRTINQETMMKAG